MASAAAAYPDLHDISPASAREHHAAARREAVRQRVRASLPPLPELRFEQAYLRSLLPALSPESKGDATASQAIVRGHGVDVQWGKVAWITVRDQVISPLLQGVFWGLFGIVGGAAQTSLRAALGWPAKAPAKA
ncbi:hypothetical protein VHUM_01140 [Vanrija humicola]|uniref:Uncharacterized protein n=1 Tax=Vanrija humicola TaxID=5417 RepID=A0A7D8Z754_VANHU|nr:hypothetical protein VHUM_01140 [Vanrija humicola]